MSMKLGLCRIYDQYLQLKIYISICMYSVRHLVYCKGVGTFRYHCVPRIFAKFTDNRSV